MEEFNSSDPTIDASLGQPLDEKAADSSSNKKRFQRRPTRPSNVYAAPVTVPDTFRPPVFPKSDEELAFLNESLSSNFIFSHMSAEQVEPLVLAFEKIPCKANEVIIRQGDEGDYMYILYEGSCHFEIDGVSINDGEGNVARAKPGDCFGELALLYTSPRAATVIADTDTIGFRVDNLTFRLIVQNQISLSDTAKQNLVRGVPFFSDLADHTIIQLAAALVPYVFVKDEYLVRKGDMTDNFFLLSEGQVNVTDIAVGSPGQESKFEDIVLGPGDYFGERAIVRKEPRAASIVALTKGVAFTIDKATFERLVGEIGQLKLAGHDKRMLMGIKIIKASNLLSAQLAALVDLIYDLPVVPAGTKFMVEGESTEAALYLVRKGKIQITCDSGKFESRMVGKEGYFAEDLLETDVLLHGRKNLSQNELLRQPSVATAKYTVEALEDCVFGVLSIQNCRCILDTTTLGRRRRLTIDDTMDFSITLRDLEKIKLIGAGTFGQVWLVARQSKKDGSLVPYALKIQSKYELIQQNSAAGVVRERKVMSDLHHPFLLRLVNAFQDTSYLYMVTAFIQGGELLGRMEEMDYEGLSESETVFYAACVFEALSYCHNKSIVYRDLKPENALIDVEGYVTLVDFGFAKRVADKTYTFLGTPLYMAPEIILNLGHGPSSDNWSWGILVYEMCMGDTPFYVDGMDQIGLFKAICRGNVKYGSEKIPHDVRVLLEELLVMEPKLRIGNLAEGEKDITNHSWFKRHGMDWDRLRKKEIKAPWIPESSDPLNTENFEDCDHLEDKTTIDMPKLTPEQDAVFNDF